LDPTLQWLWCRQAATAPIQPLAWELPYAAGVTLKKKKERKKRKKFLKSTMACLVVAYHSQHSSNGRVMVGNIPGVVLWS